MDCKIKSQTIDDEITGLCFMFRVVDDGTARLYVTGESLPFGNRDFTFDLEGNHVGSGTGHIGTQKD